MGNIINQIKNVRMIENLQHKHNKYKLNINTR